MKIKTSELTDQALDWAVAKCEGYTATIKTNEIVYVHLDGTWHHNGNWAPSTNWSQGGPIIEREQIGVRKEDMTLYGKPQDYWVAECEQLSYAVSGQTPLIAAMRCYVASKLGDEVEIPEELCQ